MLERYDQKISGGRFTNFSAFICSHHFITNCDAGVQLGLIRVLCAIGANVLRIYIMHKAVRFVRNMYIYIFMLNIYIYSNKKENDNRPSLRNWLIIHIFTKAVRQCTAQDHSDI